MSFELLSTDTLFYFLLAVSGLLACFTVGSPYILRSAVYLMGVLCASAGFYFLVGADFLAGAQILVYVGGIVVLLVFAVMLTRSEALEEDRPTPVRAILGFTAASAFFFISYFLVRGSQLFEIKKLAPPDDSVRKIGVALLDYSGQGFALPFEVISLLLLAVLIGGIVLARKEA